MKCEYCGNNLKLEDKFCPFCGKPNRLAQQHQQEMQRFSREFRKTKADVLEQSSRLNRRTVRITILAILAAMCAGMAFLCVKADDIRWRRIEKQIEANADVHQKELDRLMEERDYTGVYMYYDRNRLNYVPSRTSPLHDYEAACYASRHYNRVYEDIMTLAIRDKLENVYQYQTDEELIAETAKNIRACYEEMVPQSYHPEQWAEDKLAYMEDMDRMIQQLTVRYFGISEEQAAGMKNMSEAKLTVMLEEAYESKKE